MERMKDTDVLEVTKKDLDTQLSEAKEQGIKSYKQELIDKGFDPDKIDEQIKNFNKQSHINSNFQVKDEKRHSLGYIALATAKALVERKSVLEVMKQDAEISGDDTGLKYALTTMQKTYQSQGSSKIDEFSHEMKALGLNVLDGAGSDFGMDLEIGELLRPKSVLFQLQGTQRRTLVNGEYRKRVKTDGANGFWVGEQTAPTATKAQHKEIILNAKLVAGLTELSKRALLLSNKNLQQQAEDELIEAVAETVDRAFFAGTGSQHQPLGLNNIAGVNTHGATSSADAVQVGEDLQLLHAKLAEDNIKFRNPYWLGTEKQKIVYAGKTSANGLIMPYAVDLNRVGALDGMPFMSSNYVSTDNSVLWLIDASELIIGSGYGLMIDIDEHYDFSSGLIGIKCETALDFKWQREEAIGKLTTATNHIS